MCDKASYLLLSGHLRHRHRARRQLHDRPLMALLESRSSKAAAHGDIPRDLQRRAVVKGPVGDVVGRTGQGTGAS